MKQFIISALLSFYFFFGHDAYSSETCYIDNAPLYLYKTINWWYDSLPEESRLLCGKPIRCENISHAEIEYDPTIKRVEVNIKGRVASMLLAFKNCGNCYGPTYWRCNWLDKTYFNHCTATARLDDSSALIGFVFNNINKEQAKRIQGMAHELLFVMEGVIGGLANGQIALHQSDGLLKTCPGSNQKGRYPATVKIINPITKKVLATFNTVWQR